ncbi:MAG: putative sugar O-methyltransferase [Ignavibacteriaceae bacterium]|nr:putative sugar O-methyltransferase [Ignavibacteriaceae bacterium]
MSFQSYFKDVLTKYLKTKGYDLTPSNLLYDWQRSSQELPSFRKSILPEDAKKYLRIDNPRLIELQKLYSKFDKTVISHLVWQDGHVDSDDLQYFRGDNAYVWQLRGTNMNIMGYALTTYYLKSIDKYGLLEKLKEDDNFGNYIFTIDDKVVSRDLLDSINEIYFLEEQLKISSVANLKVLDIGAGYGRLAHRMIEALPNIHTYYCTDAVAVSTFISEYYLHFRKLENNSKVIPLFDVEDTLKNNKIDIALNIHSFSECSINAVEWWLSLIAKYQVKYLMIIPNIYVDSNGLMLSHDRHDIGKAIEKYGYVLKSKVPKFKDAVVQEYGINPTHYYLFERY